MFTKEKLHILLADDDNDDVIIFNLALNKLPFAVLLSTAEDGVKLLALLEQILPDVIFLDINMPCKTGKECIREIRSNRKFDTVPIIMYTSLFKEEDVEETYRQGANFYLLKPDSIDKLAHKLKAILSFNWKDGMFFPNKSNFVIS